MIAMFSIFINFATRLKKGIENEKVSIIMYIADVCISAHISEE